LFELTPQAQVERLRNHELDVAILGNIDAHDREALKVTRLSRHRMAAVLPVDHPLAAKRTIKVAALSKEPWISLSDTIYPGRREFLRGICANAGFQPNVVSEVDSLSMMLGAVSAGEGVALIPAHAKKLPHAGCVFVSLAAPVPMSELLLVQQKQPGNRELETLTGLIAEIAGRGL